MTYFIMASSLFRPMHNHLKARGTRPPMSGIRQTGRLCLCAMLFTLAGCLIGPRYQNPPPFQAAEGAPAGYKEKPGGGAGWKVAQPDAAMLIGPWWKIFRDPQL